MIYKYTGNKFKINGDTIVTNGDILTIRFREGESFDGISSCMITNNTTGKDIPDAMDFYARMNKYFEPLDKDAGDIDEESEQPQKLDNVNHPSHYTWLKDLCGIEVIDITRHMDFDLGNAIKYILRSGHKSEKGYSDKEKTIEDLKKAIFYINDKIKLINE
jgi:hypothetical protein